jgi:hypothetical protein
MAEEEKNEAVEKEEDQQTSADELSAEQLEEASGGLSVTSSEPQVSTDTSLLEGEISGELKDADDDLGDSANRDLTIMTVTTITLTSEGRDDN